MKYKLLVIWENGELETNPNDFNSYEDLQAHARIWLAVYKRISHIGWIEWNIDLPFGGPAQLNFFIKEALLHKEDPPSDSSNGPDRSP